MVPYLAFLAVTVACPHTADDLLDNYFTIFPHGNRNAAAHRWASAVLDCASELTHAEITSLFAAFCPVTGSPLLDEPTRTRYLHPAFGWGHLRTLAGYTPHAGVLVHCCPPILCDAVDFLHVDTKAVTDSTGIEASYRFVVIGDPCVNAETNANGQILRGSRGNTSSLATKAPDVTCAQGRLERATLSDHGGVIIGMHHDAAPGLTVSGNADHEAQEYCEAHSARGDQRSMGAIFREVASLNPLGSEAHADRRSAEDDRLRQRKARSHLFASLGLH